MATSDFTSLRGIRPQLTLVLALVSTLGLIGAWSTLRNLSLPFFVGLDVAGIPLGPLLLLLVVVLLLVIGFQALILSPVGGLEKRLQQALDLLRQHQEDERVLRTIIESAGDAILTYDDVGRIRSSNPAALRIFGYHGSEFASLTIYDLIPATRSHEPGGSSPDELRTGEAVVLGRGEEIQGRRKNGGSFPAEVAVRRVRLDGQVLHVTLVRDISEQRRSEEAARSSEQRYRLLADNSLDMITRRTVRGELLYVSPASRSLLGYEPDELIGKMLADYIHPQDVEESTRSQSGVMIRTGAYLRTYRLRRKDNLYVWVETSCRNVRMGDDKPIAELVCITRDITDRKKNEIRLLAQNQMLEILIQNHSLAEMLSALCRSLQEQIGEVQCAVMLLDEPAQKLRLAAGPNLPESFARELLEVPLNPNVGAPGTALRRQTVVVRDIASHPLWANHRDIALLSGLRACWSIPILSQRQTVLGTLDAYYRQTQDLSTADQRVLEGAARLAALAIERRWGEEALRASEERYRGLFDGNPLPSWVFDTESRRFLAVNDAAVEKYGYSRAEFLGMTIDALRAEDDMEDLFRESMTVSSSRAQTRLRRHKLRTGQIIDVDVSSHGVQFAGRRARLVLAVDMTRRRQMEVELRQAKELAEDASRTKSEFLANVSHEIRTPMTAILGFTDILLEAREERRLTDEEVSALQIVKNNAAHLLEIINDILDLSKIEAGKLDVERLAFPPIQLLTEVVSLMRVKANAKKLELRVQYLGPVPRIIKSDPTRIRQILVNLVGNAIKFTEVGEIQLLVQLRQEGTPQEGKQYLLEIGVKDTGIGMTPTQLARLFQPFSQGDTSTTRRYGGTGLGLTISRRLAQLLGGDITVASQQGQGSTFTVTLPVGSAGTIELVNAVSEAEVPVTARPAEVVAPPPGLQARILLAEDGPDNQRLISFHLRRAGAEVTIVDNGQLAVEQALAAQSAAQPFDVILMDMQMPILDGYGAARELRNSGYRRPIIALTAHAMEGDEAKCLEAGCDGYATKPIDREKLLAAVRSFLGRQPGA